MCKYQNLFSRKKNKKHVHESLEKIMESYLPEVERCETQD